MSVDEWVPDKPDAQLAIDVAKLHSLIDIDRRGRLDQLTNEMTRSEQQWLAFAMSADRDCWLAAAEGFSTTDIRHLMRALAVAEMNIAGCSTGPKSPVIYLNQLMKQRGESLSREDLLWFKQNSDNRFIPNGPLI